jgi:hypothetical protein
MKSKRHVVRTAGFCECRPGLGSAGVSWSSIFSLGIYMFWWYHDQMEKPNKHFASDWAQEEEMVTAVEKFS